ncbi:hypothetical protein [Georgenia deserti]|uniref:Uncharacterized protein n=1 Tax=Georgenia deserti TaxID=2093781 RepID=A0ABW4L6D5_9MICO
MPELTPPTATTTSWNFELLDPFVEDFVAAAEGRAIVANFATIPTWMFVEPVPVSEIVDSIAVIDAYATAVVPYAGE